MSYSSELGINLKKNLHYFDKEKLINELKEVNAWYDECEELHELPLDYRIKSIQSAILKYERYYPDHQTRKVFDDLLGFRSLCDNYDDVLVLKQIPELRIADLSKGKANDDGYRGVHAYYQLDGKHLTEFKRMLEEKVGYEKIQLVTISRPSAYGEYEPYHFVETKEAFAQLVAEM